MADTPIYSITQSGSITRIEFNASPTLQDMLDVVAALAELSGSELRLFVFEKAELLVTTAEVRDTAGIARSQGNQPRRVALAAPGSVSNSNSILRIFKVFREREGTEIAIFANVAEAEAWLLSNSPAPE